MEPLKPTPEPDDLQTAASETLVGVPLAFRGNSAIREDVLDELT